MRWGVQLKKQSDKRVQGLNIGIIQYSAKCHQYFQNYLQQSINRRITKEIVFKTY